MRALLALPLVIACTTTPTPDRATGEVGSWITGPSLPVPRANHCSAVIDNWVLVIGGNHMETSGFVSTDEIDAAQLAPDGTLGAWQVAGHTASPVSECNATADANHLYIIDGLYDDMSDNGGIFTADLDTTAGTLGALTKLGALPDGVVAISTAANIADHTLMVMDTTLPTDPDGDTTVTLTSPLANMTWATDDWHIGFREQAQYAFTDTFAYTLGGYHDPDIGAVADVFVAPIGANATVGTAVASTALPMPVGWGEAAAVDGYLFVVGGRAQTFPPAGMGGTTNVFAAPIATDGSVGTWQAATALPMARTNQSMVLAGDYLVLTGGAASGPGDSTVLVAQVRYPAHAQQRDTRHDALTLRRTTRRSTRHGFQLRACRCGRVRRPPPLESHR